MLAMKVPFVIIHDKVDRSKIMRIVKCTKCGCDVGYNEKSIWEGNRDFEDVNCPNCNEYITKIFTDGNPNPYLINKSED